MRAILGQRPLRFVFAANVISMLGSGMNSAAVAWYILQATHSEMALGTFAVLQTIPAMLMLPFTGVIIDREDRRLLVMWLDAVRAVIIITVAILVVYSDADTVNPPDMGQSIFEAAPEPKELAVLHGFPHNALYRTPSDEWWAPVLRFLQSR